MHWLLQIPNLFSSMITPEDVKRKARNVYKEYLRAWLNPENGDFFPYFIRGDYTLEKADPAKNIAAVNDLRSSSKEMTGNGYSIEWEERNSRLHGRNHFPKSVFIESETDLLWLAEKQHEFDNFTHAVQQMRRAFPELNIWIASHIAKLTEIAGDVSGLLAVAQYFKSNLRPNKFARELPIPVPTKFIEWNQLVLREWFDIILPPESINASERQFERRYGLNFVQPHLLTRLLDPTLLLELSLPYDELSLPVDTLAKLPVSNVQIFIVENRVNALTLPKMQRTMVLGGLGDGVTLLQRTPWLNTNPVYYWGDMDAEGFEALASLRAFCPSARSLFMDAEALAQHRILCSQGTGNRTPKVLNLMPSEVACYHSCCRENLRIEQERIPQDAVLEAIRNICVVLKDCSDPAIRHRWL